ncbi:OmpA family protein [Desulfovibrio mangrovi]|uniref:OmpA/MotB family protein n=1 Tax=Desulfovibrio mangrovi TaxID=2976983 RepID=UPI0022459CBD|nr:flagellar motor protein MotB [Desulfovibrio mangrovi]UZP68184.1 OmpA family protein [Desulfovibrio mangrovi]
MAEKNAAPPPKRKADEPPKQEGLPEWMATFADMVTLLLCFFVLLLSFAQQDANKFKTLMGSIKNAFGIQIKRPDAEFAAFSPSQFERKDVELKKDDQQILGMVVELKNIVFDDPNLKKTVKVSAEDQGVVMRFPVGTFFAPGSAELKLESAPLLDGAIKILKERNVNLVVRGHTNDIAPPAGMYPTNWELSSARAAALLREIMSRGDLSASRLKAVGYADSQPLLPNTSDPNRETNNRMELYLHKPEVKSW